MAAGIRALSLPPAVTPSVRRPDRPGGGSASAAAGRRALLGADLERHVRERDDHVVANAIAIITA
jgi:hypothetical protein